MKNKFLKTLLAVSILALASSCHGSPAPEISIDEQKYPNVKYFPEVGENGNWYFNDEDSGILAKENIEPTISQSSTWVVDGVDTGIEVVYKNGYVEFDVPDTLDTSREINITFWDKNDTNPTQQKIYEDAITEFEKYYPNIKVTVRHFIDYNKIYENVITNISTNTTPNVCISYPDHVATYLSGDNIVASLDNLMTDPEYGLGGSKILFDGPTRDDMIEEYLNEGIIYNHYYTMPFMRSSEALYINEDYVKKLGYTVPDIPTWDWVFEVSEKALETKTENPDLIPFIYKSEDNMMIQMLKQIGGDYSTSNGDVLLFNDTTKDLLNYIKPHATSGAFSSFTIVQYPGNYLNSGKAVFGIDSTAGATWMGCHGPNQSISQEEIVNYKMVVRPVPQFDTSNPQMISQGPSMCIFNKEDPQEVLASWLFMQFLLTNRTQIDYAKTEGYVPVTKKAQESEEYQDYLSRAGEDNDEYYDIKIEASKLVIDNVENTFITPVFNGSASLRQAAGQLIVETIRACNRNETLDDAFYTSLFNKMLSLYRITEIGNNSNVEVDYSFKSISKGAKAFVFIILGVWVLIGFYFAYTKIREKITSSHVVKKE